MIILVTSVERDHRGMNQRPKADLTAESAKLERAINLSAVALTKVEANLRELGYDG